MIHVEDMGRLIGAYRGGQETQSTGIQEGRNARDKREQRRNRRAGRYKWRRHLAKKEYNERVARGIQQGGMQETHRVQAFILIQQQRYG